MKLERIPFHLLRVTGRVVGPRGFQSRAAQRLNFLAYRHFRHEPRPDDVFIATYPKSGTTLMQMMVYQLSTDGSLDIDHIGDCVPWFEVVAARKPAYLEQLPSPRFFKSHFHYGQLPRQGRVIYILRDVRDVAVSYYHHAVTLMGWEMDFDKFLERFMKGKVPLGSWFDHLESWWPERHSQRVLFLRYEDMVADLRGTAQRVASFCSLDVDGTRLDRVVERCSIDFMRAHARLFDPRLFVARSRPRRTEGFVRRGEVGGWRDDVAPAQLARLHRRFDEVCRKLDPHDKELLSLDPGT